MSSRRVVPLLITTILLFSLGAAVYSPPCTDPAGCLWLHPAESLTVGVARVTNGFGMNAAQEVDQGAALSAVLYGTNAGHAINTQSFFSTCLPELTSQSASEISGATRIIAVLGPTCIEEAEHFFQSMSSAGLAVISPLPYISGSGNTSLSFKPDPLLMAQQLAGKLPLSNITNLAVIADPDPASQAFRKAFCAALTERQATCVDSAPDSTGALVMENTLPVWISLQNTPTIPAEFLTLTTGQPALAITLSPPPAGSDSEILFTQWGGPAAWQDQTFLNAYALKYHSPPGEFAGLLANAAITLVHQAALETAQRLWDGSWLIPRQAFNVRLRELAAQSTLYAYSCPAGSLNCQALPMALFQWSQNEHRYINP